MKKLENYQQAYEIVKNTEAKYGGFLDNNKKKKESNSKRT